MFHSLPISGHDVLRGLYMGGLRDDACVRFQAEEIYGFTIGGGKCYLVDTKIMDRLGLNGEILAHGSHEDMIDYYYQEGLIVAEEGVDKGDLEYMYIRFRRGTGASDDTAIVASGLLYGIGTAIGVFLADAIDTLEKHVPVFSDQDDSLAKRIKRDYAKLDVSEAEVRRLIYLSALPEDTCINVPDSSLRRLILIDRSFDLTAVESHLLFVQGKNYAPIRIGHEDIPNERFYTYVEDKISHSPGVR
jgi:hypothetical protein